MRSKSLIHGTTLNARNAVFAALAGATGIVCAIVLADRLLQGQYREATERLVAGQRAADLVRLGNETLTMTAQMAAATGEARWIAQYRSQIPKMSAAISAAKDLAPAEIATAFDRQTRVSNDRLNDLEEAAIRAVEEGNGEAAKLILDGALYQYHRDLLTRGLDDFAGGLITSVRRDYRMTRARSVLLIGFALLVTISGGMLLWRRLNRSLLQSEAALLEAEDEIKSLAHHDVLTGLANRHALSETFRAAIARAESAGSKLAVLMIDLDRFKPVNDRYGHQVGDLVLKEVAVRLTRAVRSSEFCGRHGGDEFIAMVEYPSDDEIPRRVGSRIVASLSEPMTFDAVTVEIGASVGIAVFPSDAVDEEELMRRADTALYRAKAEGRGAVRCYSRSMEADVEARAELEESLRAAIRTGSVTPYFQPLIELATERVVGFEILSRWSHPVRGSIPPAQFIRIAENTGVIDQLTLAVLHRACLRARSLPEHITIAINVAPQQFKDERLAEKLLAVLRRANFPPERLEVELTESALINDVPTAKRVMQSLKELGIRLALDDFGTGYSSLCYLSEFPFDKIKIDRAFVRTLHDRPESAKIVKAIIGLGNSLGVSTIAEGVESARDAAVLRDLGCPFGQGFLYSPAVPAADLPGLLDRFGAGRPARNPLTREVA